MLKLLNEKVSHKSLGDGTVVAVDASDKGTFGVERKFWFIKGKRLNHG